MIVKGKLIKCNRTKKIFKGREQAEKLYLTIADAKVKDEDMAEIEKAFAESGKAFTPEWVKKFEGFVNLATKFDLPCMDIRGLKHDSIEDEIADGLKWFKADVAVSINAKPGAVYPVSIKFLSEGEEIDAFAEFDEE